MSVLRWVDSEAGLDAMPPNTGRRVEWLRIAPFVILHGMCLGVLWVGKAACGPIDDLFEDFGKTRVERGWRNISPPS